MEKILKTNPFNFNNMENDEYVRDVFDELVFDTKEIGKATMFDDREQKFILVTKESTIILKRMGWNPDMNKYMLRQKLEFPKELISKLVEILNIF